MHSAQELVTHIDALTSLPSVYIRIREALDSPDGSMAEIGDVISADPALTARMLQVVNSPLYGYGGKIDSVHRAVTILGLQQVHDLVLAMSIGSIFAGIRPESMDMNRFWRGSVMRAIAARDIGRRRNALTAERLLVIGLLSDLGHLALYQIVPALADEARLLSDQTDEALYETERRIIGCDYTEVGATLMDHWRLPACFAEIIGSQIHPKLAGDYTYEASIINLASHIVEADRKGEPSDKAVQLVSPVVWAQLDLPPSEFGKLRELAELDLATYTSILFPRSTATA